MKTSYSLLSIEHILTSDLFASFLHLLGCEDKGRLSSPGEILTVRRSRSHPLTGRLGSSSPEASDLIEEEDEAEQGQAEFGPGHLQILTGCVRTWSAI